MAVACLGPSAGQRRAFAAQQRIVGCKFHPSGSSLERREQHLPLASRRRNGQRQWPLCIHALQGIRTVAPEGRRGPERTCDRTWPTRCQGALCRTPGPQAATWPTAGQSRGDVPTVRGHPRPQTRASASPRDRPGMSTPLDACILCGASYGGPPSCTVRYLPSAVGSPEDVDGGDGVARMCRRWTVPCTGPRLRTNNWRRPTEACPCSKGRRSVRRAISCFRRTLAAVPPRLAFAHADALPPRGHLPFGARLHAPNVARVCADHGCPWWCSHARRGTRRRGEENPGLPNW